MEIEPALTRYADLLFRLPQLHDGLRGSRDVGELLARGCDLALAESAFARAVVVAVDDDLLTAEAMDPPRTASSDVLRRQIVADPPTLRPGTIEAELIRRPERYPRAAGELPSVLAERFALERPAFGVVAPESSVVGLLVADGLDREPDEGDRFVVTLFGRMLSVVLEHVVMRARIAELSSELQHLTVTTQALAAEAFRGPVTIPVRGRHLPRFRTVDGPSAQVRDSARDLLTPREIEIAEQMSQGRSNREIADQLYLSPETVKDNVARIVRKLGAANRIDAAVRFLRLADDPRAGGR